MTIQGEKFLAVYRRIEETPEINDLRKKFHDHVGKWDREKSLAIDLNDGLKLLLLRGSLEAFHGDTEYAVFLTANQAHFITLYGEVFKRNLNRGLHHSSFTTENSDIGVEQAADAILGLARDFTEALRTPPKAKAIAELQQADLPDHWKTYCGIDIRKG